MTTTKTRTTRTARAQAADKTLRTAELAAQMLKAGETKRAHELLKIALEQAPWEQAPAQQSKTQQGNQQPDFAASSPKPQAPAPKAQPITPQDLTAGMKDIHNLCNDVTGSLKKIYQDVQANKVQDSDKLAKALVNAKNLMSQVQKALAG